LVVGTQPVVEVDDDVRPRFRRETAQGDAVAPRDERAGVVANLTVATQDIDA